MKNNAIIKAILILLEEYKAEKSQPKTIEIESSLKSLKYLINQAVRQYDIPKGNRHVSRAAHARWKELSSNDILNKHYQDKVVCDRLAGTSKQYTLFIGASKKGKPTIITEKGFRFRQMFHEDHVIPVAMIVDSLIKKGKTNEQTIKKLLNKMHICTLLKAEDHRLPKKEGRFLDFWKTINTAYDRAGIALRQ